VVLHRLIAYPESRRILRLHLAAQIFLAVDAGVFAMIPVLLRGRFGATEWQTMLATSSTAFMSLLAVFWNEIYFRLSPRQYLLLLWSLSTLPLAGVAACSTAAPVLALVLLAAMGSGGIQSVNGDLLRSCYAPSKRSRVWSLLKITEQLVVIGVAYAIGRWLDHDGNAYRWFFPIAVILIATSMILIERITQHRLFQDRLLTRPGRNQSAGPFQAYRNMIQALKGDTDFRRYETAFCIYGLGWMICYAMVPFIVIDVLGLTFSQAAIATQVCFQSTLLVMLLPMGHLMDRVGPIRLSGWFFSILVLYPTILILTHDIRVLMVASIVYGLGMAGVNLAWTLGPVSLARNAAQASQYLAIHATLVSLRALLGQVPAVAIYHFAKGPLGAARAIHIPLALAAAMFALGSYLMRKLDQDRRRTGAPPPVPPAAEPPEVIAGAEI
jgi:hypothetical protein